MADRSPIEWTEATWNPVRGCDKVSAGCKNCYAERFAERFRGVPGHPFEQGFDVRLVPEALDLPLRWRKPRRIFVNSMSDLFHEDVPDKYIAAVFGVMAACPQHTFQLLTKRSERLRRWFGWLDEERRRRLAAAPPRDIGWKLDPLDVCVQAARGLGAIPRDHLGQAYAAPWPLPNVWLGVSCEDQRAADERIPELLATPAAVRFISAEPLLGPISFRPRAENLGQMMQLMDMGVAHKPEMLGGIDWMIVGGESGPGARPCDVAWVRSLVQQCRAGCVPAFTKQLGAHVEDRNDAGFDGDKAGAWPADTNVEHDEGDTGYQGAPVRVRLRDRKGGDPAEWPADLRCREMPTTTKRSR